MKKRVVAALMVLGVASLAIGQPQASKTNYTVYEVRGDVKPPRPISTPVPPPPDSVHRQLKVRVSFVVASDGSVADVKLLKRSTPEFDDYALAAVSKWKFAPATKDGTPVAVRLETEMRSHK
ncbi:MAG: energy transducer TonB [Candidatus Sulfotelmatobacter sp.]